MDNLIGRKFGSLIVIAPHEKINGRTAWECVCDCGNEKTTTGQCLKLGRVKSCGCALAQKEDLLGKTFGRLTVIAEHEHMGKEHKVAWWCKCKCGRELAVIAKHLKNGNTQSCGCIQKEWAGRHIRQLAIENIKYTLDELLIRKVWKGNYSECPFELFSELAVKNCCYCNALPSNESRFDSERGRLKEAHAKRFVYSGLDRIDSSKDHSPDNIVPACWICNVAKSNRSISQFLEWALRTNAWLLNTGFDFEDFKVKADLDSVAIVAEEPKTGGKRLYHPREATGRDVWRDRYWDIPFEIFFHLSQFNCFYCGIEPKQRRNVYVKARYSSEYALENGWFVYNGLDRVDNSLGHTIENCVPSCFDCNRAKADMTLNEFNTWILRLGTNLKARLNDDEFRLMLRI